MIDKSISFGQQNFLFIKADETNIEYDYVAYMTRRGSLLIARFSKDGNEALYWLDDADFNEVWANRYILIYQNINDIFKRPFEFQIEVTAGQSFTLPLTDVSPGHDFIVSWGDGEYNTISSYDDANKVHSYVDAGEYIIRISGICSGFQFTGDYSYDQGSYPPYGIGDRLLIKRILSWGDVHFKRIDFNGCTNLLSLPDERGKLTEVTTFDYFCKGCTSLTTIPEGIFNDNFITTSFGDCFYNCNNISAIPAHLFDDCKEVLYFSRSFDSAHLITSIPEDLFRYNTKVINFGATFAGCYSLTTIPANLFKYTTEVTDIPNIFYNCFSLTTIPAGLFNSLAKASWTWAMFAGCINLVSVPEDLFKYMTEAVVFYGTFAYCHALQSVPKYLFRYNKKVVTVSDFGGFAYCFYDCPKLQFNKDIFYAEGEQATRFLNTDIDFTGCFIRDSFSGIQGEAPDLWNCNFGTGTTDYIYCFAGSGNDINSIKNYNDIPLLWK